MIPAPATASEYFDGHPAALAVHEAVLAALSASARIDVRTTRSQVSYRTTRAVAFAWLPGRFVPQPPSEVVLSIVLGRKVQSPRIDEVVHPSPNHWMHHVPIDRASEVDDEVIAWLQEAVDHARDESRR